MTPPPPKVVVEAKLPPPPPPPPPAAPSGRRTAGFVVGAAGIVGVAVGAGLGVLALQKKSQSNTADHCDTSDACDGTGLGLRSDALAAANGSNAGFILGALAIGGGIALVATAPSANAPVNVGVSPRVSLAWRW